MSSRYAAPSVSSGSWLLLGLLLGCTPEPSAASPEDDPRAGRAHSWGGLEVTLRGDEPAPCAVVLLHGYGAPGDDLVSLGSTVARATGCLAVMPEAPEASPLGGRSRQWWPLEAWRERRAAGEDLSREVPPGLEEASRRVHGVVDTLAIRGIDPSRVVLAGFSQGAVLALDAGLTTARPVGGIAVLSGTLIAQPRWEAALERNDRPPPVLLTHGRRDPLLTFARAEELERLLREHHVDCELVPFRGGHGIPPRARERLIEFARRQVGRAR